jgi:hypothetical protein
LTQDQMNWPPRSAIDAGTPNPGKQLSRGIWTHIKHSRISLSVARERHSEAKSNASSEIEAAPEPVKFPGLYSTPRQTQERLPT